MDLLGQHQFVAALGVAFVAGAAANIQNGTVGTMRDWITMTPTALAAYILM